MWVRKNTQRTAYDILHFSTQNSTSTQNVLKMSSLDTEYL